MSSVKKQLKVLSFPALPFLAFLFLFQVPTAAQILGVLPTGMSPDSVDFTETELYVLSRGTISVFSLPAIVFKHSFGGSGSGPGKLSPNHSFDQAIRVIGGRVLAEDNDKLIIFSAAGQFVEEKRKPHNTAWFVPIGDRFVAKHMVVSGSPPVQYIRLVIYDSQLREIKELYRQKWFQQQNPNGFSTVLLGDLLHFAVVRERICVDESPKGFFVELFDLDGNRVSAIGKPYAGVPVTERDRERELALVRKEKRVAAMIARAGSWDQLQRIWTISFPEITPALRELQASGDNLLVRTFERKENTEKYLMLDLKGGVQQELFFPVLSDAETEARVAGTAFFKLIGNRFYYLRQNAESNAWKVHMARK